jgi:hypothetical protein
VSPGFLSPQKASDPDTMTLEQALKQSDRDEFIKAMEEEILAHTSRNHWEVVPIRSVPRRCKPIPMVWSMKRKRDPAGEIIKWKARLCAGGHTQVYGDSYWDTYSPVVSWSTVRLVLILGLILGWEMRSIDFIMAYPQADVNTGIYMKAPKGTTINHDGRTLDAQEHYLKLKKNLYGLRDAGLTWFQFIHDGLLRRGFKQSEIDPCLFAKDQVVLVLYVDDAAIFSPHKSAIDKIVKSLQEEFTLTDEGDLKDYLGVRITRHRDGSVELTQPRMIERCV